MDKIIVNIGKKTYNCQVAKTEEEKRKGLMGVEIFLRMKACYLFGKMKLLEKCG